VDLELAAKTRPVVIASRPDPNPPRALVLYVPLTTQHRLSLYEVPLPRFPFLDRDWVANVQGLGSIPAVRRDRRLGILSKDVMTIAPAAAHAPSLWSRDWISRKMPRATSNRASASSNSGV